MSYEKRITQSPQKVTIDFLTQSDTIAFTAGFVYHLSENRNVITVGEFSMNALDMSDPSRVKMSVDALLEQALAAVPYQSVLFRVANELDANARMLWQAMGYELFWISGTKYYSKDFYCPKKMQQSDVRTSDHRLIDPIVSTNDIAPEKAGPPAWYNMEEIAIGYMFHAGKGEWNPERLYLIFSALKKDIKCSVCRAHYVKFFEQNPPDFYLKVSNNDGPDRSAPFTLLQWVTKCHNHVNVLLNKSTWSIEKVLEKLSSRITDKSI